MERISPRRTRHWRTAAVVLAAVMLVAANKPLEHSEASTASALAAIPPVNGSVITVAGVSDPRELIRVAPFPVASVGAWDVESQRFSMYIPGAPAFTNADLAEHLQDDTIVWLTRGEGAARSDVQWTQRAPLEPITEPSGLHAPRRGGLTVGPAGTSSLDALIEAQDFTVASVMLFDVERQRFLSYIPGAPAQVNTLLSSGALTSDSIVWIRRADSDTRNLIAETAPRFAATAAVTNVEVTAAARAPESPTPTATSSAPTGASAPTAPSSSGGSSSPTPTAESGSGTSTPGGASQSSGTRDPFLWPFSPTSPWNHPIGSGAQYASTSDGMTATIRGEASGAGMNITHWTISVFRAEGPERAISLPNGNTIARLNVPDGARPTPPLVPGDCDTGGAGTEGWADAHMNLVTSDARVLELFATKRLCNGDLETRYGPWWHDLRGSGIGGSAGAHTGSRAYGGSSMGGLVRKWELEAGEIRHALAAAMPAARFRSGYVWPATSQDSFAGDRYRGNVPMGTLAALPPDFDLDSLSYSSPYGRALAKAMRDYGVYFVDSAGNGGMKFYGEPSVRELPGWQSIDADLRQIVRHLLPVTNNSANNVGGGGTPRAPLAPPLR